MSGVPYTFGTATTSIPLSNLDSNFVTPVTIGNASVALGNTISTIGNLTLNNVTINSGTINASVTESYTLANAVVYSNSTNLGVTSANLSFNGTTLTVANDASISGLTVGKGGGAVATNATVGGLTANTTGTRNTSFGVGSLATNSTAADSTAVGWNALNLNTGTQNTAVGRSALESNSSGAYNVAIGFQSLVLNTTASNNTAVGYQAGYTSVRSNFNTFIGNAAGYTHNLGSAGNGLNTFVGHAAGYSATTGTNNTFLGFNSGTNITTGGKNTILGCYDGNSYSLDIRTASNYIVLSDGDGNPRGIFNGSGNFGIGGAPVATAGADNKLLVKDTFQYQNGITIASTQTSGTCYFASFVYNGTGIGSITSTAGSVVLYNTTSDERLKNDIGISKNTDVIDNTKIHDFSWKADGSVDRGVFAQEAKLIKPLAVSEGTDQLGENGLPIRPWSVDYSKYVPDLIVYCQQLKARIETLEAQLGK